MINREEIIKILKVACHAPSGENCQPWRFKIEGSRVLLFNDPAADRSLYNFRQLGSMVAHGCLMENILIASSASGYKANLNLFPDNENPDLVAVFTLERATLNNEPLFDYIEKRCTNRKPYKENISLTEEKKRELMESMKRMDGAELRVTEDRDNIKELSLVASMNERIVFENPYIHNFFFSHVNWTEKEDKQKKKGFYIKTLELPLPARILFRFFRSWERVEKLNHLIGLSKKIWNQNGKIYMKSSAIGIITVNSNTVKDFVLAGRATQRVWLTATKLGLSLQPMTGILFFMQNIISGNIDKFNSEQVELIKRSYKKVEEVFNISGKAIPVMFRVGYGGRPSACASKFQVERLILQG